MNFLRKICKKRNYGNALQHDRICTRCEQIPLDLKKCDNCKEYKVCKPCYNSKKLKLCKTCDIEYDNWAGQIREEMIRNENKDLYNIKYTMMAGERLLD